MAKKLKRLRPRKFYKYLKQRKKALERGELDDVRSFSEEEVAAWLEADEIDEELSKQIDEYLGLRRAGKIRSHEYTRKEIEEIVRLDELDPELRAELDKLFGPDE